MRYEIHLTIDYNYGSPSDHVRNIARLLPGNTPLQETTMRLLDISPPPQERRDWADFFGNATTTVAWNEPVEQTSFKLRARVERLPFEHGDLSPPLTEFSRELQGVGIDPRSPLHFLATSPRIWASPQITAFLRGAIPEGASVRAAVEAAGRALHAHMTFDAEATDAGTPPEQAFEARRGVCQDFAQILISGLRGMGLPAAYVSGFLRTHPPPGQPRLEGVDAMHAWVAVWCGAEQGWVEYDPTNAQWAGEDYINVAFGRDYSDVAPIHGAVRTAGGQDSRQAVDVIPLK